MTMMIAATAVFFLFHIILPRPAIRNAITARIGVGPYLIFYSVASVAQVVWIGFAFAGTRGAEDNPIFWDITPTTRLIQIAIQAIAWTTMMIGVSSPNPTNVSADPATAVKNPIRGIVRITRHPVLWGFALWSGGHMLVNGDGASLILFSSMLALSFWGMFSIDARRKQSTGAAWDAFAAHTSLIPFAAILAGRQKLRLSEIRWTQVAAGLAFFAVLAVAHPYVIGVHALPW